MKVPVPSKRGRILLQYPYTRRFLADPGFASGPGIIYFDSHH